MAKTKKVTFGNNHILEIQNNWDNKKEVNFDCVVVLHNIDDLLRKYKIPKFGQQSKQFEIGLRIKDNKLTVINQNITVESDENRFNLGIQIKNDEIIVQIPESSSVQREAVERIEYLEKGHLRGNLPRSKTLAELVNDMWKISKNHNKSQSVIFDIGQYVMAKMKSFSPWPANIIGFTKNRKRAQVYFYGTHNSGSVEVNEIALFQYSTEVVRMQLLRHLNFFEKGIKEIETELGIPAELSVTNHQNALNNV